MYGIVEIREAVRKTATALPISKVVLIGSYAKNEATEQSDIDLVIDGADLSDAYWDFLFGLEDEMKIDIDLMTAHALNKSQLNKAVSEGIVLYEEGHTSVVTYT